MHLHCAREILTTESYGDCVEMFPSLLMFLVVDNDELKCI